MTHDLFKIEVYASSLSTVQAKEEKGKKKMSRGQHGIYYMKPIVSPFTWKAGIYFIITEDGVKKIIRQLNIN